MFLTTSIILIFSLTMIYVGIRINNGFLNWRDFFIVGGGAVFMFTFILGFFVIPNDISNKNIVNIITPINIFHSEKNIYFEFSDTTLYYNRNTGIDSNIIFYYVSDFSYNNGYLGSKYSYDSLYERYEFGKLKTIE